MSVQVAVVLSTRQASRKLTAALARSSLPVTWPGAHGLGNFRRRNALHSDFKLTQSDTEARWEPATRDLVACRLQLKLLSSGETRDQ